MMDSTSRTTARQSNAKGLMTPIPVKMLEEPETEELWGAWREMGDRDIVQENVDAIAYQCGRLPRSRPSSAGSRRGTSAAHGSPTRPKSALASLGGTPVSSSKRAVAESGGPFNFVNVATGRRGPTFDGEQVFGDGATGEAAQKADSTTNGAVGGLTGSFTVGGSASSSSRPKSVNALERQLRSDPRFSVNTKLLNLSKKGLSPAIQAVGVARRPRNRNGAASRPATVSASISGGSVGEARNNNVDLFIGREELVRGPDVVPNSSARADSSYHFDTGQTVTFDPEVHRVDALIDSHRERPATAPAKSGGNVLPPVREPAKTPTGQSAGPSLRAPPPTPEKAVQLLGPDQAGQMATIAEEHHSTNLAPAATGESGLVTPKTKIVGDGEAGAQGGFPEEDFTEGERNFLMKKQEMLRRSPSKSIFSLLNASPAISLASDVSPSKSFCLGTPSPTKAKTQDRPHPPTPSPSKRSRMSADHSPSAGNTPRKRSPTGDGTESPQQIMDRLQKRWREYLASIAAGEEQAARWQRWKTKMAEIEANQLDAEERGKFFNEIRYRQLDANFNGQFLFQQVTEMIFEDKQHPLDPSGRYRLQSLLEKTIQATNGESVAAMAALAELEETEGQFARARELYSIIVDKAREGNEVALTCLVDVAEFRERQMARDAEERRKRKSRNKFKVGKNKALIDKGIKKDSKAADFMLKVVRERENIERPLLRQSLKEGFLDPMRDALERIIRNHPQDKRHLSGYKRQVHRERQREREIHEECLASLKMMAAEKQKVAKPVTSPIASSRNAAPAGLVEGKPGTLGFSARRASATAAPAAAAAPAAGGGLGGLFGKKSRGSSQSVAASSPASTAAPGSPQAETPGGAAALLGGGGAKGAGLKGMGGGGLLAGLAGAGGASGSATATITPVSVATPAAKPGNLSGAAAAQRPQTTPSGAAPKAACGPPQKSGSKEDVGKKSAGSKAPQKSGSKALHKGASTPGSKSGERTSAQMFDNLENRLMKQQKDAEREVEAEEARKRPAELTEENVVEWVPKKYQKEIAPEYKSQVERGYASDFDREVTCNHAGVLTFHTRMARAKFGQQVRRTQKKTRGGKLLKKAFLQREFESANLTGSPQQKIEENEEEENSHEDGRLHINTPPRKHRPGTAPFLRNIDVWDESKNFDLLGMLHQKSEKYYDAALSCRMLVQRRAQKQKQEEEARKQKEQKAREAVGLEAAEAEKARLEKEKRPGPPFTVRCDTDVRPNTAGIGKGIAGGRKGSKRSPRRDLRLLRPMMSSTRLNGGSKTRSSGAPAAQSQGGAGSGTGAHSASGGGGSPTRGKNVMKKKVPTPPKDPDEVNAYPDLDVVTEFNIHSGVQRFDPRRTRRTYGLVPMPTPAPPDDRYTLRALPPDVPPKIL